MTDSSSNSGEAQQDASASTSGSREPAPSNWHPREYRHEQHHHRKHEPSIANITNRTDGDLSNLTLPAMVVRTTSTPNTSLLPSLSPSMPSISTPTTVPATTTAGISSSLPSPPHLVHSSADSPPRKRKKMARTRTGCLNCRRRKRKCDETHPSCTACTRRQEPCEWGVKLTFRAENSHTILQDHPSMCRGLKRPRTYEILDVRDEVIRDYHLHMPASPEAGSDDDSDENLPVASVDRHSKKTKHREESHDQSLSQSQPQKLPEETPRQHTPQQRYKLPALLSPNQAHSHFNTYNTHHHSADSGFTPSPLSLPSSQSQSHSHSHSQPHAPSHAHPHNSYGLPSPVKHFAPSHTPDNRQAVPPPSAIMKKNGKETSRESSASNISSHSEHASPLSAQQRLTESAVANLLYLSRGGPSPPVSHVASSTASDNNILCHVQNQHHSPTTTGAAPIGLTPPAIEATVSVREQQIFPTESYHGDGIFTPGSAYLELHSLLRHHLFRESQSALRTRAGTPVTPQPVTHSNGSFCDNSTAGSHSLLSFDKLSSEAEKFCLLPHEEGRLWKNWIEEVALWMDKFDCDRTFGNILPPMARSCDHLKYAILALSARQLEQSKAEVKGLSSNLSLALYRQAIYTLLPHLSTRSTTVMASVVVLSIFEMMSCNPKLWKRHLDGCACVLEAVGINGFVGGVEQALFWVFVRMDVIGSLVSCVKPLIPVHSWASKIDLDSDVALFRSSSSTRGFGEWANYAVYLVAQVLDLLAVPLVDEAVGDGPRESFSESSPRSDAEFRKCWTKLWAYLEDWQAQRPPELQKIMCIPGSEHSPFPTIVYSNAAAMSGSQMYHTASLLMLQHKPAVVKLSPKSRSVLWHARQICGISMSTDHHGAWTSSVQPLWFAGRCMSHPAEHRAILDLLGKIESTCGWATQWRANDLVELWGDLEE
ncbi:hypothetical protein BROUX41_006619 [Berkeleyomyces rouxiae]|uniref:uncharacterized protein n=1 Tax=Berkeleyomyces rouxiae TaxID=2035830 RepID=UPI003B7E29B7